MRRFFGILSITAAIVFFGAGSIRVASASENDPAGLQIRQDDASISVSDGQRLVFRYHYVENPFKPYSDQLVSPAGVQVLRDSPEDHKHHHGLMFAVRVDGVNFWEENSPDKGHQRHRSLHDVKTSTNGGVATARFSQTLDWIGKVSPNNATLTSKPSPKESGNLSGDKTLLCEERSIVVFKTADLGATLIEWQSRLQTPPGKESATLAGAAYHGMGMRFVASMGKVGRFFNADDQPGEKAPNKSWLTRTTWHAYTASADGKPVTVAVFDHPRNASCTPMTTFAKNNPYAYMSATANLYKEPFTLNAAAPTTLTYGVALWDGEVDKKTVEALYQRWLKLSKTD